MNFRQRHSGATSWPLYADASFTWASYPISADTFGVTVCACFHPELWGEKLPKRESFNWGSMSKLLFDQCKLCCSAVKVEFCLMNIINLVWVYKPHKLHEVNFSLLQHWQHGQWGGTSNRTHFLWSECPLANHGAVQAREYQWYWFIPVPNYLHGTQQAWLQRWESMAFHQNPICDLTATSRIETRKLILFTCRFYHLSLKCW